MCPPMRRGDKESVLLEGELSGAVKQHKSATALDYCFPSAQLGVPSRSGGPHTGRGCRTQIPSLINMYTEDSSFLPLIPLALPPCYGWNPSYSCGLACNRSWTLPAPGHCLFFNLLLNNNMYQSHSTDVIPWCWLLSSDFSYNKNGTVLQAQVENYVRVTWSVNDSNILPSFNTSVYPLRTDVGGFVLRACEL